MRKVWQPVSIVTGLLLLLTYLLMQSRSSGLALRTRLQEAVQNVRLRRSLGSGAMNV